MDAIAQAALAEAFLLDVLRFVACIFHRLLQGRNTEEPVCSTGWHRAEGERRRRNRSTETLIQSWLHVWLQC